MSLSFHNDNQATGASSQWLKNLLNDDITDDLLANVFAFGTFEEAHQIVSLLVLQEKNSTCRSQRSWRFLHVWKEFFLRDGFALDEVDRDPNTPNVDFWQLYIDRQRLFQRLCNRNPVLSYIFPTMRSTTKTTNAFSVLIPNFIPVNWILGRLSAPEPNILPPSTYQFQLVSLATGSSMVLLHQTPCRLLSRDSSGENHGMTTTVVFFPKLLLNHILESFGDNPLESTPMHHILLNIDHGAKIDPMYPSKSTASLLPSKQLVSPDGSVSVLIGCALEVAYHDAPTRIYTEIYIWRVDYRDCCVDATTGISRDKNGVYQSTGFFVQKYGSCCVSGICHSLDYHCPLNEEPTLYVAKLKAPASFITIEVYLLPRWDDNDCFFCGDARRSVVAPLGAIEVQTSLASHCSLRVDSTGCTVILATSNIIQIWNIHAFLDILKETPKRKQQLFSHKIISIPIMKKIREMIEFNKTRHALALSIISENIDDIWNVRQQRIRSGIDVGTHIPPHLSIQDYGFVTLHTSSDVRDHRTFHLDLSNSAAVALPYLVVWEYQSGLVVPSDRPNASTDHESSWIVSSIINLPLISIDDSKPRVHFDGRRIIVFGQDFLGFIVLVYQMVENHLDAEVKPLTSRDSNKHSSFRLPSIPRNGMEESGGVYNSFDPMASSSVTRGRPRRVVKFIKRIRHDALHGYGYRLDNDDKTLYMSCNERFLVFRTTRGDRLQQYFTADGLLYFDLDLDDNCSPGHLQFETKS